MAEFIYLSGKAKWARLVQPDLKYNCWSVVLYPDTASYEKLLELKTAKNGVDGILNVIKKDEDGYNVTLKRPTQKVIKGKINPFAPPLLTDKDGQALQSLIGNGSDITCKIEVYPYPKPTGGKGRATRLWAVRVDNLVVYEKDKDFSEEDKKMVAGLSDQPEPLF